MPTTEATITGNTNEPSDADWQQFLSGLAMTEDEYGEYQAYAWEIEAGWCSICDGLGHGSNGRPCPLESPFGDTYCQCGGQQAADGSGCLCGAS